MTIENGVVKYTAIAGMTSGDTHFEKKLVAQETRFPHPDLTDKFQGALREVAVKVMGWAVPFDMIEKSPQVTADEKASIKNLAYRIKEMKEVILSNTQVTTIHYNGTGDTSGIVLEGKYQPYQGKQTSFKTPSVTLSASVYGIEEMLKEVSETIEDEAFEYIYHDKVSQTEIQFGE